jgi:hypothetical protein
MEAIGKTRKRMSVERGFEPGRLTPWSMAMAYERIVPIPRVAVRQEATYRRPVVRKECVCAQ